MSSYIGRHAELYDTLYAEKDYASEASFIHNCLMQYGRPESNHILEIACGTGNHSFILEKFGYQIDAFDYSSDMIDRANRKKVEQASPTLFSVGDMRDSENFQKKYDSVLCLFDSIGYVQTNTSVKKVLDNVSNCLLPGGLFIMEFWHAAAMIKNYDPLRIKRFHLAENHELLRISETSIDVEKQVCSVNYTLYEFLNDSKYTKIEETQVNRFFLCAEMLGLLEHSGLEPLHIFDGYSHSTKVDENSFHVVMICKKTME